LGKSRTTSEDDLIDTDAPRRHEVIGIIGVSCTILLVLSLASYDARGGENWIGPVGAVIGGVLASAFGIAAWVLPIELALLTVRLFRGRESALGVARAASTLVFVFIGCAMLHLAFPDQPVFGGHLPGGLLGEVIGEVLRSMLGLAGAFVVGVSALLITLVLRTRWSLLTAWEFLSTHGVSMARAALDGMRTLYTAWREAKEVERAEREALAKENEPRIVSSAGTIESVDEEDEDAPRARKIKSLPPLKLSKAAAKAIKEIEAEEEEEEALEASSEEEGEEEGDEEEDETLETAESDESKAKAEIKSKAKKALAGPTVILPTQAPKLPAKPATKKEAVIEVEAPISPTTGKPFVLPPTTLLDAVPVETIQIDEKTLRENATLLVEKLGAYNVQGRVDEIHPGPVVTMYEFEPASGTKVAKIAGLADDLAMALAAQKVRIVAPIPGKSRVGFELPNKKRSTVSLREILEDERWLDSKYALPMALGKDIAGQPNYVDLAKMPHLLVAGATGAGKSVGLNVMLASLLTKKTPEEVRFLMIDPKVVELAVFDGIPHMLLPVVTDMKKASLALRWAVDEMERRYQLFADAGARNLVTYNERVEKVLRGEMAAEKLAPRRANKVRAQGPDGEEVLLNPDDEAADALNKPPTKLPYIVCVVDEFADLMMVAAKDVEAAIARLAQKARAAGIHVILATQRPSVDVITGMIKANFPARIAFKVSQREDSKTILGRNGAEHLLGMGDMLMIPPGQSDLKRVHCAYISEEEVTSICDFLRAQAKPVYDENILKPREDETGEGGALGTGQPSDDPMYDRAVALVAQAGYCSISHIQRHLSVGYNKAAKLVEQMEKDGVVGPPSSKAGGRREVLVQAV
jgi:S-DNA-T family DNA segregation ATPase FtsK/SpoIIIE